MIAQVLLLLIGAVGMVALVLGMARKPDIAVLLLLAGELVSIHYALPTIGLGSLTVFVSDLPTVALLAATVVRPYLGLRRRQISTPLLALLLLALLGLVRGSRVYGLQISGNASREILGFCAAALFFSGVAITPAFIEGMRRWFMLAAAFIVTIGGLFWIQNGFGEFSTGGQRGLRGLDALVLLFATIIAIVLPYGRTRTRQLVVPAIGFVVLLLSLQRSVAISGIVALVVLMLFGGRVRTRRSSRVTRILVLVGGLAVAVLVLAGPTGLTQDLSTAVETSTAQEGTFSWRLEGWRILVGNQLSGSVPSILVGEPAGTSNLRVIGDSIVTVAPHSEYVSLFQSVGLVGLSIMVWLLISTFRRNVVNVRSEFTFTATVGLLFATLLASQVTYFISYSAGVIAGMVVGLAVSLAWFGAVDPEIEERREAETLALAEASRPPTERDERRRIEPPPIDQPTLA